MSIADLWDRMFWSIMLIIGVGLLWIRFIEPYGLACVGPGLLVALAAGGLFFALGVRGLRRSTLPAGMAPDAAPDTAPDTVAGIPAGAMPDMQAGGKQHA